MSGLVCVCVCVCVCVRERGRACACMHACIAQSSADGSCVVSCVPRGKAPTGGREQNKRQAGGAGDGIRACTGQSGRTPEVTRGAVPHLGKEGGQLPTCIAGTATCPMRGGARAPRLPRARGGEECVSERETHRALQCVCKCRWRRCSFTCSSSSRSLASLAAPLYSTQYRWPWKMGRSLTTALSTST